MTLSGTASFILFLITCGIKKVNSAPFTSNLNNGLTTAKYYQEGDTDKESCIHIVAKEPEEIFTVEYGSCLILSCTFNLPMEACAWEHGTTVEIEDRYSYVGEEKGWNTTNCSLEIKDFQTHDESIWRCNSMATEKHDGSVGATMKLKGKPKAPEIFHDGRDIKCLTETTYKSPTQLYWLINGEKRREDKERINKYDRYYDMITMNDDGSLTKIKCTAVYDDDLSVHSNTVIIVPPSKDLMQIIHTDSATIAFFASAMIAISIIVILTVFLWKSTSCSAKPS